MIRCYNMSNSRDKLQRGNYMIDSQLQNQTKYQFSNTKLTRETFRALIAKWYYTVDGQGKVAEKITKSTFVRSCYTIESIQHRELHPMIQLSTSRGRYYQRRVTLFEWFYFSFLFTHTQESWQYIAGSLKMCRTYFTGRQYQN